MPRRLTKAELEEAGRTIKAVRRPGWAKAAFDDGLRELREAETLKAEGRALRSEHLRAEHLRQKCRAADLLDTGEAVN